MKSVPRFVLVVACINSKKYKESEILAEYLEGIPHIKYEGHGSFTDTTCYILKNSAGFHNILDNIDSDKCTCRFMAYAPYEHLQTKLGVNVYQKYSFSNTSNMLSLPTHLGIADSDLDKLIAITKG
jgi:hypothetical protein